MKIVALLVLLVAAAASVDLPLAEDGVQPAGFHDDADTDSAPSAPRDPPPPLASGAARPEHPSTRLGPPVACSVSAPAGPATIRVPRAPPAA